MVVPYAHFGHVLVDLPIFFGPVLMITIWLLVASRKRK